MHLNTIKPAEGSRKQKVRLGRGIGSTLGKTSGKGHKGQKARAGGYHKVGFEGGQMPLQRRLPKVGFKSRIKRTVAEVRLHELNRLSSQDVTLTLLKESSLIPANTRTARVIDSGELVDVVRLKGIKVTRGAKQKIEALGGTVEV
jgi:large subunit ribosomal protein L15